MNGKLQVVAESASGAACARPRPAARAVPSPGANELLAVLPAAQLAALLPHLELVYMARGACLYELGSSLNHVYFPARGIVSLGYVAANGETTELALVGREGVIGVEAFLGTGRSSHRACVQAMCAVYRLPLKVARSKFAEGGAFQQALLKYAHCLMLHISQTSICNLHHSLEQRLCRSLLQSVDRAGSNTLLMTQDMLASLVGGRRQGISEAIQKLRDRDLIACERGSITVLDRDGLLGIACECHVVVKARIERLVGVL